MTRRFITPKVEISGRPRSTPDPAAVGYDLIFPIGTGDRAKWMNEINTIFLNGVPRGLRDGAWVYLLQGREIFFSAPIDDVLFESRRLSDVTGDEHGGGPCLMVDLQRGRRRRIDVDSVKAPDGKPWHTRRGIKYVTPGCREIVRIGPKPPAGAMKARSSPEIELERALARRLAVDRGARRLRILDGALRPNVEVDICIPEMRLVVEYDGGYWHEGGERRRRDKAKTERLRDAGLRVIRVRDGLPLIDPHWDIEVGRNATPDDIAMAVVEKCRFHRIRVVTQGSRGS